MYIVYENKKLALHTKNALLPIFVNNSVGIYTTKQKHTNNFNSWLSDTLWWGGRACQSSRWNPTVWRFAPPVAASHLLQSNDGPLKHDWLLFSDNELIRRALMLVSWLVMRFVLHFPRCCGPASSGQLAANLINIHRNGTDIPLILSIHLFTEWEGIYWVFDFGNNQWLYFRSLFKINNNASTVK